MRGPTFSQSSLPLFPPSPFQALQLFLITHVCVLSSFSHVQFFVTLGTLASQAPLSMGFSRQEYWSGLSFPPPGDLPNPGIQPLSLNISCVGRRILTTRTTFLIAAIFFLRSPLSKTLSYRVFSQAVSFPQPGQPPGPKATYQPLQTSLDIPSA